MNDVYNQIEDGKNVAVNKLKSGFQKYFIYIILLCNIAFEVISKLYKFGIRNPFSIEFLVLMASTITTSMITYICFIPIGKQAEDNRSLSRANNIVMWGKLTDIIRNGYLELFGAFCHEQEEEEREEARKMIIGNHTLIPYADFCSLYKGKSKKEINILVKESKLSCKEARAINRANGYGLFNPTKIKPISPLIILSGVGKSSLNDAGRSNGSYAVQWLIKRPFVIFFTNAVLNSLTRTYIGAGENLLFDICSGIILVVVASICGYSAGVNNAKEQNGRIKSRVLFISLFCEKNKINLKV